jgi:hypothetical protein
MSSFGSYTEGKRFLSKGKWYTATRGSSLMGYIDIIYYFNSYDSHCCWSNWVFKHFTCSSSFETLPWSIFWSSPILGLVSGFYSILLILRYYTVQGLLIPKEWNIRAIYMLWGRSSSAGINWTVFCSNQFSFISKINYSLFQSSGLIYFQRPILLSFRVIWRANRFPSSNISLTLRNWPLTLATFFYVICVSSYAVFLNYNY